MTQINKSDEDELILIRKELALQKEEKIKLATELEIVRNELALQIVEKDKKAEELVIANKEIAFQKGEKGKGKRGRRVRYC